MLMGSLCAFENSVLGVKNAISSIGVESVMFVDVMSGFLRLGVMTTDSEYVAAGS